MKSAMIFSCLLLCASLLVASSHAVEANQGQFALALAQVLGFEVFEPLRAVDCLLRLGIMPNEGWKIDQKLTNAVANQVEASVQRAVAAGLLKPGQAEGAVAAAAASLGFAYIPEGAYPSRAIAIPWYAPLGGPPADPVYREGSPFRP